jgi:outer membrane protein TolC
MSRSALAGLLAAVAVLGPLARPGLASAPSANPAAAGAAAAEAPPPSPPPAPEGAGDPAERLVRSLPAALAELAAEVLDRNPDLARLRAAAAAAELRAPQVRSLPDPMASLTAFLLTPETRVGPQRASLAISQRLPWFGELGLREREALYRAAAAHAEMAAKRLALVTETRRLIWELAFLDAQERAVEADRETVAHGRAWARRRLDSLAVLGQGFGEELAEALGLAGTA